MAYRAITVLMCCLTLEHYATSTMGKMLSSHTATMSAKRNDLDNNACRNIKSSRFLLVKHDVV